jgi:hypothetical protein
MLWPSESLWDRLIKSTGGIWAQQLGDGEQVFVCKFTRSMLKHVKQGCKVELLVATIQVTNGPIRMLGAVVHDDITHPITVFGPTVRKNELDALAKILDEGRVKIYFFDDACVQTLEATARFSPMHLSVEVESSEEIEREVNTEALDLFQDLVEDWETGTALEKFRADLEIEDMESMKVSILGGHYVLGAGNEGDELEHAAELLLDGILPYPSIRNPLRTEKDAKELCDVLGFGPKFTYHIVVQAKVDGIFAAGPERLPEKRWAKIRKNITKAIHQGTGAVRSLRRGVEITAAVLPEPVKVIAAGRIHVVILLSEMYSLVDWVSVAEEMVQASAEGIFVQAMDMGQFQRLVSACLIAGPDAAPRLLDKNLEMRWQAMQASGNALVLGRVKWPSG